MAALPEATIALIKIDYEESGLTVDAIGVKFGVSPSYICRLARNRGWLMRSERMGRSSRLAAPLSGTARALIAQRLCGVINKKIDQMEKDMNSGELSSADLERDAKTIASMIGGVQRVVPVPVEDKVSKPDVAQSAVVASTDEVERLQREIIERFERIQRRREVEGGSQ